MGSIEPKTFKDKNGNHATLRSAKDTDAKALNELARDVYSTSEFLVTLPEEFSVSSEEQQVERIRSFQKAEGNTLLVIEQQGGLVAMLDFQAGRRKRSAHKGMFGMSVKSTHRNQGLGRILLQGLIDWVRTHPTLEVISLSVMEENIAAVSLYKSLGFEVVGRDPFGVKHSSSQYFTELVMSLRVKS